MREEKNLDISLDTEYTTVHMKKAQQYTTSLLENRRK